MFTLDCVQGSAGRWRISGDSGAFTDKEPLREDAQLHIGSPVKLPFADGSQKTFTIKRLFDPSAPWRSPSACTISRRRRGIAQQTITRVNLYAFVRVARWSNRNLQALEKNLAPFPNAKWRRVSSWSDNQIAASPILNIPNVRCALVIVILFRIVNNASSSTVFQRTREISCCAPSS